VRDLAAPLDHVAQPFARAVEGGGQGAVTGALEREHEGLFEAVGA
jgi:hypothetical protein